ncbi:MAG TPA: DUF4241 domain-containing protein [Bacteroidia bacterium]|nr:DUF4241 domain-containing protein [Bacteroidia bacterium]
MDDRQAIEQRIRAFIEAAHTLSELNFGGQGHHLQDWQEREQRKRDWVDCHAVSEQVFSDVGSSYPPEHDPAREKILSVTILSDNEAIVETRSSNDFSNNWFSYEIRKTGGNWLVSRYCQHWHGPEGEGVADWTKMDWSVFQEKQGNVAEITLPEGLLELFEGPCYLWSATGSISTRVEVVGSLKLSSGYLAGGDSGYWTREVNIFERRVPCGEHPVEVVMSDNGRPVATRMVFQPGVRAERYLPASGRQWISGEGWDKNDARQRYSHVLGVDAGNIALADAALLLGLPLRELEHLSESLSLDMLEKGNSAVEATAPNGASIFCITSGYGDGAYEARWGVDERGETVDWIIDFGVGATPVMREAVLRIPDLRNGENSIPLMARSAGIELYYESKSELENRSFRIACDERNIDLIVTDDEGTVLFRSGDGGSGSGSEGSYYYIPEKAPDFSNGLLHLSQYMGDQYRHAAPRPPMEDHHVQVSFGRVWSALCPDMDRGRIYHNCQKAYSERAYHNWQHVSECLEHMMAMQEVGVEADWPAIERAIWFHDLMYDPTASDNEEKSAQAAQHLLSTGGLPQEDIDKVAALILATKTHEISDDLDTCILLDIDLTILGSAPERYAEYEAQIREEYSHVPTCFFLTKRKPILENFLKRDRLYATDYFRGKLESRARINLSASISRMEAEIKRLTADL